MERKRRHSKVHSVRMAQALLLGVLVCVPIALWWLSGAPGSAESPFAGQEPGVLRFTGEPQAGYLSQSPRIRANDAIRGSLIVQVRGQSERAVAGAVVQLIEPPDRIVILDGSERFTNLMGECSFSAGEVWNRPSTHMLHVSAEGYAPWHCGLAELQQMLRVVDSGVAIEVLLVRGATIHGTIVDRRGNPCPSMDVVFSGKHFDQFGEVPSTAFVPGMGGDALFFATTDKDGHFTITGLGGGPCHAIAGGKLFACCDRTATGWSGAPYFVHAGRDEHIEWVAEDVCVGILDFGEDVTESFGVRYSHRMANVPGLKSILARHWNSDSGGRLGKRQAHVVSVPAPGEQASAIVHGWLRYSGCFRVDVPLVPAVRDPAPMRVSGVSGSIATGLLRVEVIDATGRQVRPRFTIERVANSGSRSLADPNRDWRAFGAEVRHGEAMVVPVGTYTIRMEDLLLNGLHPSVVRECHVTAGAETVVQCALQLPLTRVEFHAASRYCTDSVRIGLDGTTRSGPGMRGVREMGVTLRAAGVVSRHLPPGVYSMWISRTGFEPDEQEVIVSGDVVKVVWPRPRAL